jgi:hypothetical protein
MILFAAMTVLIGTAALPLPSSEAHGSILYIGDSHSVGTFGRSLDGLLRARYGDDRVWSYASCGSRTSHWISGRRTTCGYSETLPGALTHRTRRHRTPLLQDLLVAHRPVLTVVSLGGNHRGQRQEVFVANVRALAQLIRDQGSQCLWIGPPPGRQRRPTRGLNRSEIQDLLPTVLADLCTVIDSRHYVTYPRRGGDGIHFDGIRHGGSALARQWARGVFDAALPVLDVVGDGYANVSEPPLPSEIFTEP